MKNVTQICNSHGFSNHWVSTKYHHVVFREIVKQVEEQYDGNCIVIDHTWISIVVDRKGFKKVYPNVEISNIDHVFYVGLLDTVAWHSKHVDRLNSIIQPNYMHKIPYHGQFSFWGYYAYNEFISYKDIDLPWTGDKLFLSYNRKPYEHRVRLIEALEDNNVLSKGIYTLGNNNPNLAITIEENADIKNADVLGDVGIPNNITSLGNHNVWQECFINIVTETDVTKRFWSEKIFKPIIGKRPFMVIGPKNTLKQLQDWGFRTFNDYWDESYNTYPQCPNDKTASNAIANIIADLSTISTAELKEMYNDMASILEHNHNHFFNNFATQNQKNMMNIVKDEASQVTRI